MSPCSSGDSSSTREFGMAVMLEDEATTQARVYCRMTQVFQQIPTYFSSFHDSFMTRFPVPDAMKNPHRELIPPLFLTAVMAFLW